MQLKHRSIIQAMEPSQKNWYDPITSFLGFGNEKAMVQEADKDSFVPFGASIGGGISPTALMENDKNWVYVCVDKIAETMSGVRIKLMKYNKDGDDTEVFDHKILDLIDRPNKYMTGADLMYMIAAHLELVGNSYTLLDKDKAPTQMFPLLPQYVTPVLNAEGTDIVGYSHRQGSFKKQYDAEQVLHDKYPNPANPFKGRGSLEKIAEWIDTDNFATDFNRRFFSNGALLSGNLETEYTDQKSLELARIGFEMRYKGSQNMHKVGIFPKGTKYVPSTATAKDMQFAELDTRFRDKILSAFGVPKSVLGIVEDVNRASAEASNYVFMKFTIKPKMTRLTTFLTEFMLPKFSGTDNLYFTFENIVPDDEDLKLRQNTAALGGAPFKTVNEVRGSMGLAPIENGDEVMGSFANIPVGAVQESKTVSLGKVRTDVSAPKQNTRRMSKRMKMEASKDSVVDKAIEAIAKSLGDPLEAEHKQFIVRVTSYEKKLRSQVKSYSADLRKSVLEKLPQVRAYKGKAIGNDLIDKKQEVRAMIDILSPILGDLVAAEGKAQMDKLPVDVIFDPANEKTQKRLKELVALTGESYTDTTIQLLNKKLGKTIADGGGMAELTATVNSIFDFTETARAARIARTATFGVANTAAREAYKQSGVVKTVKWHTAEDELVCEFCGPMNNKIIDVDEIFFGEGDQIRGRDGGTLDIDFSDVEDPPLHANCRCFTAAETISVTDAVTNVETKDGPATEEEMLDAAIKILEQNGD